MLRDRYGWSVQPRIVISLVLVALVLLAVSAAFVIHLYAISGKDDRDAISFGVTTLGAGVGIYGLMRHPALKNMSLKSSASQRRRLRASSRPM